MNFALLIKAVVRRLDYIFRLSSSVFLIIGSGVRHLTSVFRLPFSVFSAIGSGVRHLTSVFRFPFSVFIVIRSVVRRLALALRSARAKEGPASRLRPSGFAGQAGVRPAPSSSVFLGAGIRRLASGVRSADGSALIIVLWVVGLLSLFVMAFAFDMHVEARITSSWRKKLKAEYLAKAGVELARMMLFEIYDPDIMNNLDTSVYLSKGTDEKVRGAAMSLAWGGVAEVTRELGQGTVIVTVCPVNVRTSIKDIIDVNNPERTAAMWEPLFEAAGVPWEKRDALIDCLLDWVDQDEMTHLNGAESDYYESLEPPYESKNAAIDVVEELALIKGFDEKLPDSDVTIYEKLADYLTADPTSGKININATSLGEIMSIGIDGPLAEEIIARRQGPDLKDRTQDDVLFKDINDLQARVPGIAALPPNVRDKIVFKPGTEGLYTVLARGKVGDVEHAVACKVRLDNKNSLTIMRWIEGDAIQANLISR